MEPTVPAQPPASSSSSARLPAARGRNTAAGIVGVVFGLLLVLGGGFVILQAAGGEARIALQIQNAPWDVRMQMNSAEGRAAVASMMDTVRQVRMYAGIAIAVGALFAGVGLVELRRPAS